MKKNSKSKAPKIDPYIDGLMAKLLERLVSLERKMDIVVSHTQVPRPERMMYEAVCADCNKVCEVPFKPTEARAVYCKSCWAVRKSGGGGPRKASGMLTPVALPPKPVGKLHLPAQVPPKKSSAKKSKKKKR